MKEGRLVYLVCLETMFVVYLDLKSPGCLPNLDLDEVSSIPVVQIATRKSQFINVMVILEADTLVVEKCP